MTKAGWKVIKNPPTLFRRYPHQASQVKPLKGGSIERLREYLNIKSDDDYSENSVEIDTSKKEKKS